MNKNPKKGNNHLHRSFFGIIIESTYQFVIELSNEPVAVLIEVTVLADGCIPSRRTPKKKALEC